MSRRGLSISGTRELRRFQREKEGGGAAKNPRVLQRSALHKVIVGGCEVHADSFFLKKKKTAL